MSTNNNQAMFWDLYLILWFNIQNGASTISFEIDGWRDDASGNYHLVSRRDVISPDFSGIPDFCKNIVT